MGTFLGCLFAFFIGLFFVAWALLHQGLRFILSLLGIKLPDNAEAFRQQAQQQGQQQANRSQQQRNSSQSSADNASSNGKIFMKDESEYVEFEDFACNFSLLRSKSTQQPTQKCITLWMPCTFLPHHSADTCNNP